MAKTFNPKTAVYTPAEASSYAVAAVDRAEKDATRAFPIDLFDDYVPPFMPGELVIIQAQTSNYKSGFMHYVERVGAKRLQETGRGNEAIIHISVEELIETQMYLHIARESGEDAGQLARGKVQDWTKLRRAALQVGTVPIYRIGASLARAEDMPDLYLSNMYRSLRELVSGEVTGEKIVPAAIFVDYLQAFPIDPEVRQSNLDGQRRLQVRQDIYRCREMAAYFSCPVILAAQSKQHLEGANPPLQIPGVYDIEETSSAAQRADRVLSLWLPKTSYPIGKWVDFGAAGFAIEENMLLIKIGKQRGGMPAGRVYQCRVDYKLNEITVDRRKP